MLGTKWIYLSNGYSQHNWRQSTLERSSQQLKVGRPDFSYSYNYVTKEKRDRRFRVIAR